MRCGTMYLDGTPQSHISATRTPAGVSVAVTEDGMTATWLLSKDEAKTLSEALLRAIEGWDL